MALVANLSFLFQFTKSGAGVTGKTDDIDVVVKKLTRGSTPTISTVNTGSGITVGSVTEVDATNAKGVYVVGVSGLDPAADYLASANYTGTASDVDLVNVPALQSEFSASINGGALPQFAAESLGGLYTRGTGAGQIAQDANGRINVNVVALAGFADRGNNLAASFITAVTAVAATGMVSLNSVPRDNSFVIIYDAIGGNGIFRFGPTNLGDIWIDTSSGNLTTILGLWQTAINANVNVAITNNDPTLNLTQGTPGAAGNISIVSDGAPEISFSGMSGGVTGVTAGQLTRVNGGNILSVAPANGTIATATFASGATIPHVTLVDTLTTYTGNTPQTGDSFTRIGAAGAGLTAVTTQTAAALALAHGSGSWESSSASSDYSGTARGGSPTTIQLAVGASSDDNYYNSQYVVINRGLFSQQSRPISLYNGTTKTITITGTFTNAPTNGTPYEITGQALPPIITVQQNIIQS